MQDQPDEERYRAICLVEGEPGDLDRWLELRRLFVDREGWHFSYPDEDHDGDPCWCLGLLGECRVAVSVDAGRFVVFVYDDDQEIVLDTVDAVERWLAELDVDRFLRLSPLAWQLLEEQRPRPDEAG